MTTDSPSNASGSPTPSSTSTAAPQPQNLESTADSCKMQPNVADCSRVPFAQSPDSVTNLTPNTPFHESDHPNTNRTAPLSPDPKRILSALQLRALPLIAQGLSDSKIARQLGVNRATINRWRLFDPLFSSRLNRLRHALWANTLDHLRALLPESLAVLQHNLRHGDDRARLRAAIQLLKISGTSRLAPNVGPDNVKDVLLDRYQHHRRRKYNHKTFNTVAPPTDYELEQYQDFLLTHAMKDETTDDPADPIFYRCRTDNPEDPDYYPAGGHQPAPQ